MSRWIWHTHSKLNFNEPAVTTSPKTRLHFVMQKYVKVVRLLYRFIYMVLYVTTL